MASVPLAVLIGPPAAGKTRVGKRIAKILGVEFIDTDRRIVDAHGAIAEIFSTHGEEYFRSIERETVAEALSTEAVVSLGGGAVLDLETRAALAGKRVVHLTVSPEAVARRISGQKRPLLSTGTPDQRLEAWERLAESRRDIYESLATRTWDTSARPISVIAQEIAEWTQKNMAGTEHP